MVAGIVFQMAAITVFCALFAVFLKRTTAAVVAGRRNGSGDAAPLLSKRVKTLIVATSAAIAFIYVRSIYRTIELLQGWDGFLITHEVYFVVLDGVMMVCAVFVFNLVHPGWFLVDERRSDKGKNGGDDVEMESRPFSTASTVEAGAEDERKEGTMTPGRAI